MKSYCRVKKEGKKKEKKKKEHKQTKPQTDRPEYRMVFQLKI